MSTLTRVQSSIGNFSAKYPKATIALIAAVALLPVFVNWHKWRHWIPDTSSRVGDAGVKFAHAHPRLGTAIQFLLNAIPDAVPLFLGLAGLGYLIPDLTKKIEHSKRVRLSVMGLFVLFAIAVIAVNAINRASQDEDKAKLNEKIGVVQTQNTSILTTLTKPTESGKISESDRKQNIERALRNEYILSHNPIDQEILAGTKMPPDVWMNERLQQLGERWKVADAPKVTAPLVTQQVASEGQAHVEFSFYRDVTDGPPITMKFDPLTDGKATFSIGAIVRGDVPAENLQIWIRRCDQCEWASPNPSFFAPPDPDRPQDRTVSIAVLPPNVVTPKLDFTVNSPRIAKFQAFALACYYACKNCPPVDWKKPQTLYIVSTMQTATKLQFPHMSFEPANQKK
ncbi:MAG: hypothetical protein WCA10_05330 [Terracidiphilus sp.]